MDRIQDVEEVLSWRALVLGILIREVSHHLGVLRELWIEGLDSELIVVWHLDRGNLRLLEQMFLTGQNISEEIFVDDGLLG